jgi:hypothetical protein
MIDDAPVDTAKPLPACLWCGCSFTPRRGGSPRVFCASGCRTAFHTAARLWAERAVAAGSLTIADLQNGDPAACKLGRGSSSPCTVQGQAADAAMARLDALLDAISDELSEDELMSVPEVVLALVVYADELSRPKAS